MNKRENKPLYLLKKIYGKYWANQSVKKWIVVGFLFIFLPVLLCVIYDIILGYTVGQIFIRNILDIFLGLYSIVVNLFLALINLDDVSVKNKINDLREDEKNRFASKKFIYMVSTFMLAGFILAFFTFFYDKTQKYVWICLCVITLAHIVYFLGTKIENDMGELNEK